MDGRTPKYRAAIKDPDGAPVNRTVHPDGYATSIPDANGPLVEKERRDAATETLNAKSVQLEIPKDNDRYTQIIDWIANGEAILRFEERSIRKVDDKSPPIYDVWLCYLDIRGYIPSIEELSAQGLDAGINRFSPLRGAGL